MTDFWLSTRVGGHHSCTLALYVSVSGSFLSDIADRRWKHGLAACTPPFCLAVWRSRSFIASAETLLCATAVDQMHQGPRTNYDRELFAQGVGNTLCGLLGSIPMTGVIVRSSANIEAGGRTRGSAIFHGIWLLGAVSLLPWLLNRIPTTSLAAILVFTGFKLVSPKAIRLLRQYGKSEVAIYAATVIAIVTTDLLKGVLFGLVLSLGKLIYTFSHLDVKLISNQPKEGQMTMELRGAATFVRLPKLAAALEAVPGSMHLHIVLDKLDYSFSSPAQYALECAGELAKNLNAKMYVLHVAEYSNVGGDPDASELLIPNYIPEVEKKGKDRLDQIALKLRQVGVDAHSVYVAGRAYHDIVRMAKKLNVDLTVLATHGRTGFSHLFFGSTAEKVVRLCPCPVLTVKHPDYASEKESKPNDA